MVRVLFPQHLMRHIPLPGECRVGGATVAQVIECLELRFPGLAGYLLDDAGALRQHVNIFLGERLIRDRQKLSDAVADGQELVIMPALSGG